jgi:predicted permease
MGRASRGLVGFEIALSSALLVITALMVSGVVRQVDRFGGLSPEDVLTARLELRSDAYPDTASVARFYRNLFERLSAEPGVGAVVFGTVLPGFRGGTAPLSVDGRDVPAESQPETRVLAASPGLTAAFGAGLSEGRDFTWGDGPDAPPVALVNRRFAERHLAGDSPLGRRVRLGGGTGGWITIVGVVPDLERRGRDEADVDAVYRPLLQSGERNAAIALRVTGDPLAFIPSLRMVVRGLDPDVPLFDEHRMDQLIRLETSSEKLFGGLFSAFGLAALIMASVGLFGMVAFTVRQRSREMGIRQALGARPGEIIRQVARGAALQLGLGLLAGLGLAALLAPLFGDALMGANPHDWRWYAAVAGVLAGVGVLACAVPARRALRLSPASVLKEE